MAPLDSLEHKFPLIDTHFRDFCASHGIFSVEDFLMHDLYMLTALAEQHSNSVELKQGITQILGMIDNQHQPWVNGMQLLEDAQLNKRVLSVGCESIDAFLQGGLHQGQLTELVGPSSSGKTQICLKAASSVARYSRVMFIDTGNSFSPKRVVQLVNQMSDRAHSQETLQDVMNNIVCHSVYDIFSLLDMLHHQENISKPQAGFQVRMLIVDSISSLITPILGGIGAHGHALMVSTGVLLKKIAHEHNLSVLVTNHMVAGEGGVPKPALGDSWKSIPHVRFLLSRDTSRNINRMSILRHPSLATGVTMEFKMS